MSEGRNNVVDEEFELVATNPSVPDDEPRADDSESNMNRSITDLQRDLERADAEFASAQEKPSKTSTKRVDVRPTSVAVSTVSGFSSSGFSKITRAASNRTRKRFRHATSIAGASRSDAYDDDLLHRAVQDAGRWAYGTIFVEVWLLTEDRVALVRPEGGWWIDPVHHQDYHNGNSTTKSPPNVNKLGRTSSLSESLAAFSHQPNCPVCRLTDESRNDYIQPGVHVPGEGLPGTLWADDHHAHFVRDQSTSRSRRSISARGSFTGRSRGVGEGSGRLSGYLYPKMKEMYTGPEIETEKRTSDQRVPFSDREDLIAKSTRPGTHDLSRGYSRQKFRSSRHLHHTHVVWRNIKALVDDPDQPWNPRLHHMATKMGLGWAAAVPIRHNGEKQGICIYMARENVDLDKLQHPTNENYLVAATNLISAALILRTPRHEAVKERLAEFSNCMDRIRTKILEARALGIPLDQLVEENYQRRKEEEAKQKQHEEPAPDIDDLSFLAHYCARAKQFLLHCFQVLRAKATTIYKKSLGANVKPPPRFTWNQSFHTFCGVLITGLILTHMNRRLQDHYGFNGTLILGPFGALSTLLYGLTAAPASQPRNAILGQTMSITIALLLQYIPLGPVWTVEIRGSLAAALAISAMTKTGLTHPPAGAAAVIMSQSNSWNWCHLGVMIAGNVVAVLVAAVVNNFSDSRQYPTYWGLGFLRRIYDQMHKKKED